MRQVFCGFALGALMLGGCASDLAQGYRSTPDYGAYADARDGQADGIECAGTVAGMAVARSFEKRMESEFGGNFKSGNPDGSDWLTSLLMGAIFVIAEEREPTVSDLCASAAAADSSARRRW